MPSSRSDPALRTATPPRVVVVGDELADRVRSCVDEWPDGFRTEIVSVPSYLAAIGELGRFGGDAVVGHTASLQGMAGSVADALRQARPGVRLLAVASPDDADADASDEAARAGFAPPLSPSVEPGELALALGVADGSDGRSPSDETLHHEYTAPADPDAPGAPADPPLGDVDLVEQILSHAAVLPLAIEVMQQHAGLDNLHFIEPHLADADAPDEDRLVTSVEFDGETYGSLTCCPGEPSLSPRKLTSTTHADKATRPHSRAGPPGSPAGSPSSGRSASTATSPSGTNSPACGIDGTLTASSPASSSRPNATASRSPSWSTTSTTSSSTTTDSATPQATTSSAKPPA